MRNVHARLAAGNEWFLVFEQPSDGGIESITIPNSMNEIACRLAMVDFPVEKYA